MTNKELLPPTPEVKKLKALGKGLEVKRVCGERVLVRLAEEYTELDEYERKGLAIPDYLKKEKTPIPTTGVVTAVGNGVADIAEGDMVMFSKFAGTDFLLEANRFRIMDVKEIIAVIQFAAPVVEIAEDDPRSTGVGLEPDARMYT